MDTKKCAFAAIGREKLKLSDDWHMVKVEMVGDADDVKITLCVPEVVKSGKNKGTLKYPKKDRKTVFTTMDEVKRVREELKK